MNIIMDHIHFRPLAGQQWFKNRDAALTASLSAAFLIVFLCPVLLQDGRKNLTSPPTDLTWGEAHVIIYTHVAVYSK